ncbi:hypothetical protein AYO44_10705 [Planctomycetaceae bacterium SCGC AG-212-F19]|nr:hypothetical protein AYO44_10705 [Planctomycetaceae bacterium SCGC AG-212-F19]
MDIRTILHPTDYSELSQAALRIAVDLAHRMEAELVILHVVDSLLPEHISYGEATAQRQPETFQQHLWDELRRVLPGDPAVRVAHQLREGEPATEIVREATERPCELIVLGSHGRTGLVRVLLGSIAEQVMRQAPCPVLIVKTPPATV